MSGPYETVVGLGRIELPTSPLSGVRSSQLSYRPVEAGGAGRDRTGDLLNANQALSQLSYSPRKSFEADWTQGSRRPASRPLTKTSELLQRSGTEFRDLAAAVWSGTAASVYVIADSTHGLS